MGEFVQLAAGNSRRTCREDLEPVPTWYRKVSIVKDYHPKVLIHTVLKAILNVVSVKAGIDDGQVGSRLGLSGITSSIYGDNSYPVGPRREVRSAVACVLVRSH